MTENILEIKNLEIEYKLKGKYLEAIKNINLSIKKGEVFGLVGESGSGKSTLGRAVLRLLPASSRINNAKIIFKKENLLKLSEKEMNNMIRGKEIAMVMQNPHNALNPVFKIGKQILDVLYFKSEKKKNRKELKNRAVEFLKKVGISDPEYRFNEYPYQFSDGMKQRVMLAMAFISDPALLIADEATTALDLTVEAQILNLLANLVEEFKTSILYISHDIGVVAGLSDRIGVMYAGRIVEIAKTKDIISVPNHPYTEALLRCLPDYQKKDKLITIPGKVPDLGEQPTGCNFNPRCKYSFMRCRKKEPPLKKISSEHYSACFLNERKKEK